MFVFTCFLNLILPKFPLLPKSSSLHLSSTNQSKTRNSVLNEHADLSEVFSSIPHDGIEVDPIDTSNDDTSLCT